MSLMKNLYDEIFMFPLNSLYFQMYLQVSNKKSSQKDLHISIKIS